MTEHDDTSTVGAYEAKTHFSELLARVEEGQEVTITRHGTPVAKMVPVAKQSTAAQRRQAIENIRKLAARNSLRGMKIKNLISEGRR